MTQILAHKWRPKTFSELIGQEHVMKTLTNALRQRHLHHAYLFTDTRSIGKTTLAHIITKALNCETGITTEPYSKCTPCVEIDTGRFIDLIELDATSNTQVNNMHNLLESALYTPTNARFKIYIIDEMHMLSRNAFNTILKTLEEPPAHVKFILATTDPQKIPITVLSRCLQFNLKQIPQPQIKGQLQKILELKNIANEDEALTLLARAAHGSIRDSLSLLDQAITHSGEHVEQQAIRAILDSIEQEYLHDILSALQRRNGAAMIAVADRMAERNLSFEIALQELTTILHRISLTQTVPKAIAEDDPEHTAIKACTIGFGTEEIQLLYQIALHGRQDIGLAPDDYAGFTIALMRMLAFIPEGNTPQPNRSETAASKAPAHAPMPQDSKKKSSNIDWNALIKELPLTNIKRMLAHNYQLIT